jgi:hypothetical protein
MICGELRIETLGTRHHLFSREQVQGAVEAHFRVVACRYIQASSSAR